MVTDFTSINVKPSSRSSWKSSRDFAVFGLEPDVHAFSDRLRVELFM